MVLLESMKRGTKHVLPHEIMIHWWCAQYVLCMHTLGRALQHRVGGLLHQGHQLHVRFPQGNLCLDRPIPSRTLLHQCRQRVVPEHRGVTTHPV